MFYKKNIDLNYKYNNNVKNHIIIFNIRNNNNNYTI